jgi:cytidylate kinase
MAIVTISRGSMSGGEALASCLGKMLSYPTVGREVLVAAAEKMGISEEQLTQKMMRGPGLWERMTSNRRQYVVAVQAALAEHIVSGDLVYHGHAGHLLLQKIPTVLRVRLIAPLEMRVRAVMEKQQLNRDAAVDYIQNIDEDRVRWTKFIYGADWRDPALYDLVINLERMSVCAACAMIVEVLKQPEFATTDALKTLLVDFRLACRVKLALSSNIQTRDAEFEVTAADGAIEISGELPRAGMLTRVSERDEGEIRRTAEAVEGVKAVFLNLRKFDAYH